MKVRVALLSCLFFPLLLGGACSRQAGKEGGRGGPRNSPAAPNLVLVLPDTLRAANLPIYGYPRDTAPFLRELADESLVFEHHLANYSETPFSVSQMQSGRFLAPLLMGYDFGRAPVRAIDDDLLILPKVLREHGYVTGLFTTHHWFNDSARLLDYFDEKVVLETSDPEKLYPSFEELLPEITAFLEQRARSHRPFFLYVHTMEPHFPYRAHEGFDPRRTSRGGGGDGPERYDLYDSEILYTDHWNHRLVNQLQRLGMWDDTVFVFTSDHGEDFNERGAGWWNARHGATVHRSLLHVPLLIRAPPATGLRGRRSSLSRHIDLAPTLLGLLLPDLALDRYRLDGYDLLAAGVPPVTESTSYSPRYWGLHRISEELHYDPWNDRMQWFRIANDEHAYPRPVPMEGDDVQALVEASAAETRLLRFRRNALREIRSAPRSPEKLDRIFIGLPTEVVRGESAIPTYRVDPADNFWTLRKWRLLRADPRERPGPLVLTTPWVPGRYRFGLRLDLRRTYPSRFRIHFLGGANPPLDVEASQSDADGWIDLGEQRLGDRLLLKISHARGGLFVRGLSVRRIGAEPTSPEGDRELEKRLRGLGYVHFSPLFSNPIEKLLSRTTRE